MSPGTRRRHVVAAAPDTPAGGWELRGGLHGDTAAFANVLANLGVLAPHTGEPLSEAMVLGVGGGLGGGAHLRELYAQFLDDAMALLDRPALGDAARAWRAAAGAWEALVDTALPPGAELRTLMDRTNAAVARGDAAADEAAAAAAARWELQARLDAEPPVDDVPALFAALGKAVAAMHAAEQAALDTLAQS